MITSLEISGLRGIREGKMDNLTPLVILVGPNGCGKSTVLDALLVGASENPQAALDVAVRRHVGLKDSARWLLWRGEQGIKAYITTTRDKGSPRKCALEVMGPADFQCQIVDDLPSGQAKRAINRESTSTHAGEESPFSARLLEEPPGKEDRPLHQLVTLAYQRGRRDKRVVEQVRGMVPGMEDVRILTEGDRGTPVVHLVLADRTVPVTLAGDGIHALLRVCFELASLDAQLVLLEEPESHQHPAAMRQTAWAIVNAVREGMQVVLTTHSLELLDGFLAESSPEDIDRLSVYRLQLIDGKLVAVAVPGRDVAFARGQIEEDLR